MAEEPQDILEHLGIERSWLKFKEGSEICTKEVKYLELSSRTLSYIAAINNDLCKLRDLIDRDYKAQVRRIERDE